MKHWRKILAGLGLLLYFCIWGNLVGMDVKNDPEYVITPSPGPEGDYDVTE